MNAFQMPSPVILSSRVSVAPGNNATPNMAELSYPFRRAVVIDEIRFDLDTVSASAFNQGCFTYAKFMLGQHYLMRDPVPIWLLGTSMGWSQIEEVNDNLLAAPENISSYRWRLPKPLYIEAGQVLRPVFNVNYAVGAQVVNTDVQVTYSGYVVPPNRPRPSKIEIPYVAPFVTTYGNTYQQSNENHLFNPFDQPLWIQRLTGRLMAASDSALRGLTPVTAGSAVTVQLDDSWGGKMVRDLTGPGDVFDALRAGWTVDTVMPPKTEYLVKVWNLPANQQVHVAMIGSREERL